MNDVDLDDLRARLLDLRRKLTEIRATGDAAAEAVELDQTRQGRLSRMDAMQAQAMSQEAKRRRESQLREVAAALGRIETDDFGWCIDCGEPIGLRRLEFDPIALRCIGCAERNEQA